MNRVPKAIVFTADLWLTILVVSMVQEPPKADTAPQPPTHQDAPAPEPHPELKALVETRRNLVNEGKYQDALQKADELLQQAQAKSDKVGVAQAYGLKAQALQKLNRLDEAAKTWQQAHTLWQEIGDGAYQVEALLGRAFCLWRSDKATAERLIEQ
ncbi:MAG: tetratricopeptide repeat protein, partial [Thermofilaceae archaeon]